MRLKEQVTTLTRPVEIAKKVEGRTVTRTEVQDRRDDGSHDGYLVLTFYNGDRLHLHGSTLCVS